MRFLPSSEPKLDPHLEVIAVNKFVSDVAPYGHTDAPPKMLGDRDLNVVLTPLPRNKRARNPRQQPAEPSSSGPTPTPLAEAGPTLNGAAPDVPL
jgi:hypothetical protein